MLHHQLGLTTPRQSISRRYPSIQGNVAMCRRVAGRVTIYHDQPACVSLQPRCHLSLIVRASRQDSRGQTNAPSTSATRQPWRFTASATTAVPALIPHNAYMQPCASLHGHIRHLPLTCMFLCIKPVSGLHSTANPEHGTSHCCVCLLQHPMRSHLRSRKLRARHASSACGTSPLCRSRSSSASRCCPCQTPSTPNSQFA